jgi:hypothetical protein
MIATHEQSWLDVAAHVKSEIEKRRTNLERPELSPSATEFERGALAALRGILALGNDLPEQIQIEPVDYMRK